MIAKVILWKNGVVMVFDELGQQMPEYQGTVSDVATKIMLDSTPRTEFYRGAWNDGHSRITNTEFAMEASRQVMPQDKVVEAVRADLLERSRVGIKKYGVTLERTDLSTEQWLEHIYEELLDAANYTKRVIMGLKGEL